MQEEGGQGEPLLASRAGAAAAMDDADRAGSVFPWMTALGFAFLTFHSAMAAKRSNGYRGPVAFVVFSYQSLLTLFLCLRWFERLPPGSATRGKLKAAAWVLTTVLAVISSFKVAGIMPVPVQLLVWGMAVATVVGGSYAFFVYWKKRKVCTKHQLPCSPSCLALCVSLRTTVVLACASFEQLDMMLPSGLISLLCEPFLVVTSSKTVVLLGPQARTITNHG
jgi:hypothetical protein